MITFPLWFKFFLGLFCFLIITGTLRHFTKNKIVVSVNKLPIEKKKKFMSSYASVVKIHKLLLFLIPINLLAVPYAVYMYQPDRFFHISVLMVMVYVIILDDLIYRRSILNNVKET